MGNKINVTFLYTNMPQAHAQFAEAINAKSIPISRSMGKSKYILNPIRAILAARKIAEDSKFVLIDSFLPVIPKILGLMKGKKLIMLVATPWPFYLKFKRRPLNPIIRYLANKVDAYIPASDMIHRLIIETLGFDENLVRTVNPVPSKSMYNSQIKIKPKLKSNNILFIAAGQRKRIKERIDSKGLALTIEAFKKARPKIKDLKPLIVGKWPQNVINEYTSDGVHWLGNVTEEEKNKAMEDSSLYVSIANGDPFQISAVEACLAGLPTIVSEYTGVESLIKQIKKDFVVPVDTDIAADRIIQYFNLSINKRRQLSKRTRRFAKKLSVENERKNFKSVFYKLAGNLQN
ncbi:MAG: glycosyltransferase family 4 protein [Candidatus Parvarchaeota archaeon]|nr:glycosyltransferase family 4 protein [Candidatus Parvarchaeota archaeon]